MSIQLPVRVLQVGMSPYYGGTEAFIMSHYREIDRDKVQFDFLNVYNEKIACEEEITRLGGHVYHLDMSRQGRIKEYYRDIDRFFKQYSSDFQAIHCNFQSLINIDCLIYAKKFGIPVRIAHAHNSGYGHEPNWKQKLIIARNKGRLNQFATSYFACSDLAAQWMFNRNAEIINNSIDARRFKYDSSVRDRIRSMIGFTKEKVIIFVGRLDPQKNPLFLLDILHVLVKEDNDYRLLIVGDGILKKKIENRIVELNLQKYVFMMGTRNDIADLLQAADVFVLPSKFEGLGIVLVEAQAAGIPCFTSNGVVPKSVKLTDLLTFVPLNNNPNEWADNIQACDMRNRKDTYSTICAAGYDITRSAESLEKKYLSLLQYYLEAK